MVQVPILLGGGIRLWEGVEGIEEQYDVEAVSSPSGVTHFSLRPSMTCSAIGPPPATDGGDST